MIAILFIFRLQCSAPIGAGQNNSFNRMEVPNKMIGVQSRTNNILKRETRHFAVYKRAGLVLLVEDKPGMLLSSAHPPPEGAPKHPFVNAQAMDSRYENELGAILKKSESFDQLISFLIESGYDIRSYDYLELPMLLAEGYRISDETGLLAVVWNRKGQFSTLSQQPERDYLIFEHATLTVYDSRRANLFIELLETTRNFDELLKQLRSKKLKCIALSH
jgi:hypothetical protein